MSALGRSRLTFLSVGLVVGLVLGLNLKGLWPTVPLHATATHGQDNFAIATGVAEDGVEAFYFLDFLTGNLKAAVIQPRLRKFIAFFEYNILADFGGAELKNPNYLIVTGLASPPRGAGQTQLGQSLIYIAEATTGVVCCYALPYNTALAAAGRPQNGTFVPFDKKTFRQVIVRDTP